MTKTLSLCCITVALFLTGCSTTNTLETNQTSTGNITQINTNQTGIESCDKYLGAIRCMAQSNSGAEAQMYIDRHNQLLLARKDIPVKQLDTMCQSLLNNLINNPTILISNNCKL